MRSVCVYNAEGIRAATGVGIRCGEHRLVLMSEQLAFTVNMYQSSTRKNFLDILADPTAIAILGSIALHAIIGTTLPFFTQPEKEGKKAGPSTVKVVQLTPNELQRIPQVPPTPQVAPPVTKPAPTARPSVAPTTPKFSTAPQTIPFSPVRTPNTTKPPSGKKEQIAAQKKQPTTSIFDPDAVFQPTPTPTKPPSKKGDLPKKTVAQQSPPPKTQPQPKKTPTTTAPSPRPTPATDDDGTDASTTTPATTPKTQAQQPTATPQATTSPTPSTAPTPAAQPADGAGGGGNGIYGKYTQAATERVKQYLAAYPDIKLYPPKILKLSYPTSSTCTKVKQPPFIVLMVAFDKVPENPENNVLGDSTAQSIDKPYVAGDRDTPENRKLGDLAANAALYDANKLDQNRPTADKGKRVLYQYRVQFDPATCKN
jgi:hypothetical protein